jgi:hypothetical protein
MSQEADEAMKAAYAAIARHWPGVLARRHQPIGISAVAAATKSSGASLADLMRESETMIASLTARR